MEELEQSLDPQRGERSAGGEAAAAAAAAVSPASAPQPSPALASHSTHYQFHSDSRAPQAVIPSPSRIEGSPAAEAMGGEARFAYLPTAAVSDATTAGVSLQPGDSTLTHTGGQFYLMMTPPDVLQPGAPRSIAPHPHPYAVKMESPRTPRDERRRAQHNEVERRRRDKINNWIVTLSKIIPDCNVDSTKTGASKGGILSKACDYIQELRRNNHRLQESLKEVKRVQMDNEILRQQVDELKSENAFLRARLQRGGSGSISGEPSHCKGAL
ncbi:upstream stimulatory factor 2 [Salminus brasiliensis]|uniref:upstream stimulatory factor 2 n=1 Tax=Salminus brasiliensis TaxID=930266 RepID=UPI003B8376C0